MLYGAYVKRHNGNDLYIKLSNNNERDLEGKKEVRKDALPK